MGNSWTVGTMYIQPNGPNGEFAQPGGPNTPVYPQQATGVDYFSTHPFSELSGIFSAGCGHSCNYPLMQREVDVTNNNAAVMLICCPICTFIQYSQPYEDALNTVNQPVTIV